jgi:SAM-dependent methyltransferase
MSDWQERITRDTAPGIRGEHQLRYQTVAPLIATSDVWADLGCGTGLAAAAALGDRRPPHAVLVDLDADAVADAARELDVLDTHELTGDLTDPSVLERIGEALLGIEGERFVSCFEVVEHLSTFLPLLEWTGALAREGEATFVLSVPNDAFWSIENPYHAGSWGEGALEELALLLPPERTLMRQVALSGSALVGWGAAYARHQFTVEVGGESAVATHYVAAFGPRHHELERAAVAAQNDLLEQRRWERQRESNLALAEAIVVEQRATIASQHAELVDLVAERDEWRSYIHELERELGKPLSGSADASATDEAVASEQVEPRT